MKQRSCWRAECRGHGSLSAPMCPPWSYPWSWAMCNKSAFTAIQKRLQSFFASFAFLCPPFASRASHHSTWKPILFHTTRLQAYMLHTTCPASFTPRFLQADFPSHHAACKPACFTPLIMRASHHTFWKPVLLHTTHPASLQASHHTSCELHTTHLRACMLHTTRPASFTPRGLQACRLHTTHHASLLCFTPHVLQAELLHTTCPARFTPLVLQAYMLHTIHPASLTPLVVEADFASHHSSRKPSCFTPHVLQAHMLHTTHPASFTPHVLGADLVHTLRLASHFTSHHLSCMLHTTQDTGLCDRQRDPKIAPVLRVRYPVPQTLCKLHPTQFESQSYY